MQIPRPFILTLLLCLIFPQIKLLSQTTVNHQSQKPKNIVLMIGDGMGIAQVYAAMDSVNGNLNILRCTNTALVKTNSANADVTDSGAAGTAIATGHKTNNKSIGVTADNVPVKSILKIAEENGLATGLVATSDITHATPASFIANVTSRYQSNEIARQFLTTDIDVFIGGGYDAFAKRKDSINFTDSLKSKNYKVVTSVDELVKTEPSGKIAGLLYPGHAPKILDGRGDMLSVSTEKALSLLEKDEDGFFLMIEGSQIDWGNHDNNYKYVISELLDFDKAVGKVLDFAVENPETLVIVVADHESGGLTLIEDETDKDKMKPSFSTDDHSAVPVALFAFGPGAEQFKGLIDNTDIFRIMLSLYDFKK